MVGELALACGGVPGSGRVGPGVVRSRSPVRSCAPSRPGSGYGWADYLSQSGIWSPSWSASRGAISRLAHRTVLWLLLMDMFGASLAAQPTYPEWDGKESISDYAGRTGLAKSMTLDLGNGESMNLALVPAGRYVMGTTVAWPERVCFLLVFGSAIGLTIMIYGRIRSCIVERRRFQFGLRWLLAFVALVGIGQCGWIFWWDATVGSGYRHASQSPRHEVLIERPLYVGACEVTQSQYRAVTGENPSCNKGSGHPVEFVARREAEAFCALASVKCRVPVRLLSEAEWEYACRGGTRTWFHVGDCPMDLMRVAWCSSNSARTTHPVGEKEGNAFGLHDMHGNVAEWCADDWHSDYRGAPGDGRAWLDEDRSAWGVVRGGSVRASFPYGCASAVREMSDASVGGIDIGFRIAVDIVPASH